METTLMGCPLYYQWQHKEAANAPTVLLLHGWGCDSTIFSFIQTGLSDKASLLVPDFPGHGKSGEPPAAWGVGEYAQQIVALMDELGIPQADIIAHSFGGRVGVYMAAHYPNRVNKLVITGGAGIRKPISQSQQKRQSRYKRYTAMLNAAKLFKPLHSAVDSLQNALRQRYGSPDYIKLSPNMRGTFVKVVSEDLFPLLSQIQAPTLLIWGSEDTETPLWMGQQMEQAIPDAGLVIFEGRSHFAFVEEWQRFLLIIKEFILEGEKA